MRKLKVNLDGNIVFLQPKDTYQLKTTFEEIDITNECDYEYLQRRELPVADIDEFGLITAGDGTYTGTDAIKITYNVPRGNPRIMYMYVVVEKWR